MDFLNQVVFVPNKPLQPSLIFSGKARVYPSEAHFRCSTLGQAPGLTHKYQTRLEGLAKGTLAYYKNSLIMAVKSFIVQAPDPPTKLTWASFVLLITLAVEAGTLRLGRCRLLPGVPMKLFYFGKVRQRVCPHTVSASLLFAGKAWDLHRAAFKSQVAKL